MTIAIIGAGSVGRTLGSRWAALGHNLRFGVRDPAEPRFDDLRALPGASVAGVADAVAGAEIIVLATRWQDAFGALDSAGDLGGRVLIDATNPLTADLSGLLWEHGRSGGEQLQARRPDARVVKCFNACPTLVMADPRYAGGRSIMFACGDDDAARAEAVALSDALGFDTVAFGGIENARITEHWALACITLAFRHGFGADFGFGVLRR